MRRTLAVITTVLAALLAPRDARADGEVWLWTEHQARLTSGSGDVPQTNMRFTSNARFAGRSGGLEFGLARLGPVFAIAPWLTTATTGTAVGLRSASGAYVQEYRAEIDLVPHGKLGDFAISTRHRFEYVWRESGPFTRNRNLLRVAYAPKGATWIPFAFADLFLRPTRPHLQETWAALGLGRVLGGSARLDVAYMLRARDGSGGELDHVTWLMLFFGAQAPSTSPRPEPHGDAVD